MTRPAAPLRPGEAAGMTVITAAQSDQLANWDTVKKHGLFTEYFLEAVYGKADDAQYRRPRRWPDHAGRGPALP